MPRATLDLNQKTMDHFRIPILNRLFVHSFGAVFASLGILSFCGVFCPVYGEEGARDFSGGQAQVTEHIVWRFTETTFVQPIKIGVQTKGESSNSSPELAAASQFAAMISLDVDKWASGWEPTSRRELGFDRSGSREPEAPPRDWKAHWAELAHNPIYLVAKAETPDFVLIAFEIHKTESSPVGVIGRNVSFDKGGVLRDIVCFERIGNLWMQTNRFADNPVALLWRSGQKEVTKLGKF